MDTSLELAEKASRQSDRTLFISVIIILTLLIMFAFRQVSKYFVKQYETLITDHKEARQSFETTLVNLNNASQENQRNLVACVERNTICIDNNSHVLSEVKKTMDETSFQLKECREDRNKTRS